MKNVNTYYNDLDNLKLFIKQNSIFDNKSLLIQVFTGVCNEEYIKNLIKELSSLLPTSKIIGATTDGEIMDGKVSIQQTVLSFTQFEYTTLKTYISKHKKDGYYSGVEIAKNIIGEDTKLLIAFADGINTNGEGFLEGIASVSSSTIVAGGLAGDNAEFKKTYVFDNKTILTQGAVAISFNSTRLIVNSLYNFNWQTIGQEFIVTKSINNRVYTLDNRTAYDTYAHYLGEDTAIQLPKIGIEFPLIIERNGITIARAVIAKHDDGSLSFAGNLKNGDKVKFGYGDTEGILRESKVLINTLKESPPEVHFIYSCMARRRFLENGIEYETMPLQDIAPTSGFFTYGEFFTSKKNELLNQTMTIVSLQENGLSSCKLHKLNKDYKIYSSRNALINLLEVTSKEMKAHEKATKDKEVFEMMFEKSADGILIIKDNSFLQCNQKIIQMLGYSDKETLLKLKPGEFTPKFQPNGELSVDIIKNKIENCLEFGEQNYELKYIKADGTFFWAEVILIPIDLGYGEVIKAVYRDISKRKQIEGQLSDQKQILYYQSRHDILTGLPNRTMFQENFQKSIEKESKLTLMFIDLDGFKSINDSLGHDVGDNVLKLISTRLHKVMTSTCTLFRLGGDEFTIILENINDRKKIDMFSNTLLKILSKPVLFNKQRLDISGSIGICTYPDNGKEFNELLKNADIAMYKAKELGGNQFVYFENKMSSEVYDFIKMKANLHEAVKNFEFEVYYQPQIHIDTEKLIGVEALIRWNHPLQGTIAPDGFISLARDIGLMVEIDWWVMKTSMLQMKSWQDQGFNVGTLALNLTLKQLEESDFFEKLTQYLNETGFSANLLELELEESEVMKNPNDIITKFLRLHDMGIKISIDDFGTGYSSLAYLKKLPIDKLKIDRSFVLDIPFSNDSISIAEAIISMSNSLNIDIIAEGVENIDQINFFKNTTCKTIQGYYFSKPLSSKDMMSKYFKLP